VLLTDDAMMRRPAVQLGGLSVSVYQSDVLGTVAIDPRSGLVSVTLRM